MLQNLLRTTDLTFRTRFAPSPTGPLHLGHAYSALLAYDAAKANNGEFLLRIEDIDQARARPQWQSLIYRDLAWLGLIWPLPVMLQSDRLPAYQAAIHQLWDQRLIYPCSCNRRDIAAATAAPQEGAKPAFGPDGMIYPGTCRPAEPIAGPCPTDQVLRLDMRRALAHLRLADSDTLGFQETGQGPDGQTGTIYTSASDLIKDVGDIVLARQQIATSYHLSVVLDDAAQGITQVIRGADLFEASKIHIVLQRLLGLATPIYHHHRLIRDNTGKRLAKRDDARALQKFRADGSTPEDIRRMVGL